MLTLSRGEIPQQLTRFFRPRRLIKPKDDLMTPHRLYEALMADGWYGRSDVIWARPNPMPESVRDRPTKAHSYVFLLAKQPRYFFDQEAVRELTGSEMTWDEYNGQREAKAWPESGGLKKGAAANKTDGGRSHPAGRNVRTVWEIPTQPAGCPRAGGGARACRTEDRTSESTATSSSCTRAGYWSASSADRGGRGDRGAVDQVPGLHRRHADGRAPQPRMHV